MLSLKINSKAKVDYTQISKKERTDEDDTAR